MPAAVVTALIALRKMQAAQRLRYGQKYQNSGIVFCNKWGGPMWAANVREDFREMCRKAGLGEWTPREMRHTFASILSDSGVDIEQIADAMGHANSTVTRSVYRHALADKTSAAARAMDSIAWTEGAG
jgi:integrase